MQSGLHDSNHRRLSNTTWQTDTVRDHYRDLRLSDAVQERRSVWRHLVRYLRPWIHRDAPVIDIAAGTGDFLAVVDAPRRVALDIDPQISDIAVDGVESVIADACSMEIFEDATFGTAMASNFLEHLEWHQLEPCLTEIHRILRPGGHLIVIQPNFRIRPQHYFDDFTHRAILTHHSLRDLLRSCGYEVLRVEPRFLPLTLKSRLRHGHMLTPLYLKLPYRPFASQMLVIARRPPNTQER